ncbi:kelch motif protein (macronuclear) [Tetrahymena thermophila SB210]|uniref:Kelch motif protein n=1 Tax=Tetrahymena thermophila (strain SB210) TaxID=312017 RepID=W7X4L3_TETTS|nr:kelch motif protein [Tetrahymena thermophila SB210]EWS72337.1 kelch motif protein [Tetrahymena thermophila SB210]|eukprot:XP_012655114.1 kelch motif protein [Tetrahymena thermophila SB210]
MSQNQSSTNKEASKKTADSSSKSTSSSNKEEKQQKQANSSNTDKANPTADSGKGQQNKENNSNNEKEKQTSNEKGSTKAENSQSTKGNESSKDEKSTSKSSDKSKDKEKDKEAKEKGSNSQQNSSNQQAAAELDKLLNPPTSDFVLKNQAEYLKRGQYYINKNQFESALKIYELLNDANPNKGNAQILAGHCAFRLKKHEKVISYYQKAMELSAKANKDPNIHFELGIAHYRQGKFIDSEQFFNKVNVYQQKYIYQPIVDLYKAILKRQNGYHQEAAQLFLSSLIQNDKNIFNQQKTVEILCNAGLQFELMKELEDAQTCYQKAKQVESTNSNALKCLSWILFQKKSYRESADLIQKAYQQNNKDFEILLILAKNYDQQGQVKQALEYFNKAIQVNSQNAICWCYLGITFFKLNMMKDAFSCFNKSFELENNIETLFNIALLYEIGKHYIEAVNLYKQILMVCPDDHMVVRRKITIERNASSQTHDPFNKKQLNKLRTMLREPPFKPSVPLWLEELDPNVKQRLLEQERQELLNTIMNNQISLNQLNKSPLFSHTQKARRNSVFNLHNLHTPHPNFGKEPFDSLLNTPNLFFNTPKPNYENQFTLTPINYPINNPYDKSKAGNSRSGDFLQVNQKKKSETPSSLFNIPLYGDFNDPYTPNYKPSPYIQPNHPFGGLYKSSFDNTDLYRNRASSISPLPSQNLLKIEDQGFGNQFNMGNKDMEDDPQNSNNNKGGFKLRKNSENNRQRKASIASNTSPLQRPVKKPSENHSDSDPEKPLKKQIKIVSLNNPLLTQVPAVGSASQQAQNISNPTITVNLASNVSSASNIPTSNNHITSNTQIGNNQPNQQKGEVFYGSLMNNYDDELNNAVPSQQQEEQFPAVNQRFNIFSNLGRNKQNK